MPYEAISEEEYKTQVSRLQKLAFGRGREQGLGGGVRVEEVPDKFCETDSCTNVVSHLVDLHVGDAIAVMDVKRVVGTTFSR